MSLAQHLLDALGRLIGGRLTDAALARCEDEGVLSATVRQITEFGRAVASANTALAGERRLEVLELKAEAQRAKNRQAYANTIAHARRALDLDPAAGDEMDTDERSPGRMDRDDLEQVRRDFERQIGELARALESKGMLDRVIAAGARKPEPELAPIDQPAAMAPD